jgi:hypothetical protein
MMPLAYEVGLSMDGAFWLGLAAAIPLGIVTNLLTPRVQRAAAARNAEAKERQESRREADRKLTAALSSDPHRFAYWLSMQKARLLWTFIIFSLVSTLPFTLLNFFAGFAGFEHLYQISTAVASSVVIVLTTSLASLLMSRWRRMKQISESVAKEKAWLEDR